MMTQIDVVGKVVRACFGSKVHEKLLNLDSKGIRRKVFNYPQDYSTKTTLNPSTLKSKHVLKIFLNPPTNTNNHCADDEKSQFEAKAVWNEARKSLFFVCP